MFGETSPDWQTQRRTDATSRIVQAAWELARENGLAGLSLRDLARRLGMATTSLYSYIDSKHALYDAMYAVAWREFLQFEPPPPVTDLRTAARLSQRRWVRFSLADPVRFQLISYRTIPGFEPSPESYALAEQAYDQASAPFREAGVTQDELDMLIAVANGLIGQQLANQPGGQRWIRLVDEVTDLVVDRIERRLSAEKPRRRRQPTKEEA